MTEWSKDEVVAWLKLPPNERGTPEEKEKLIVYSINYIRINHTRVKAPKDNSLTISDIDQELALKLSTTIHADKDFPFSGDSIDAFHNWLWTTVNNKTTDIHRKYLTERNGGGSIRSLAQPDGVAGTDGTPSELNIQKEHREILINWINQIEDPNIQGIALGRYVYFEKAIETAKRLEIDLDEVNSTRVKLKKRLRKHRQIKQMYGFHFGLMEK